MCRHALNLPYNWGRLLMAVWKQQNADAYWKTKKGNFSVPAYIQYELTRFRLDFVSEKPLIKRSYNYSTITSKDMVSFWNGHRELFTRYQGDSFSYDEVATVIKKRIREKEYEQEIQNILRKQH